MVTGKKLKSVIKYNEIDKYLTIQFALDHEYLKRLSWKLVVLRICISLM